MAGGRLVKGPVPKTPTVEIIDLTSDEESENDFINPLKREANGDAPVLANEAEEEETGEDQWESESLYEDAIEEMEDDQLFDVVEDSCTLDEALAFRKRLHTVGEDQFITETVEADTITAKKLCTAFGIRPPQFLED
ncbi:MAG: NAD-dependent histone deacetylase sir2, partial [Pleopsidium flavum]